MPAQIPGYVYDIFISYRQKDNKYDGWVTDFVSNLKKELEATLKDDVSVYFDENPRDGLLENHQVDESLHRKLKCLILIPVISQTYCDPKSFAWQKEFLFFLEQASCDKYGLHVQLANGNVGSRILPIKIHELSSDDERLILEKLGRVLRPIEFVYRSPGVNRPLQPTDTDSASHLNYRNQINKVANAIKGILEGLKAVDQQLISDTVDEPAEKVNLKEEIRKQDLMRVGLVYLICALVLWKVVELSSKVLNVSDRFSDITAIALLALFPLAIFLAWKFEKSPSGFVRSNSADAKNNPFTAKQKKPLTSNSAILSFVVIVLVLYFVPQRILPLTMASSSPPANKSIAVLYFDNMTGDPGEEYLSDGLTEEIITRLTKIDGFRVISRTSVRVYKGQSHNLKQIAKDLNVSVVLEGSVRRSGDKLRVVAQLINAETDEHLWSDSYDRELTDVFKVQTELAQAIADRFEISRSPEVNLKVQQVSTKNARAYDYYLQARYIAFNQYYYIFDTTAFHRSRKLYEKAIELDPEFALAYAGLADLYDAAYQDQPTRTPKNDSLRHRLSEKAYYLDPNSAFVNNVRVWMYVNREKPMIDSGLYHARKALLLEANDYYNHQTMGDVLFQFGMLDSAIPFYEKAAEMNPLDAKTRCALGTCYWLSGNREGSDIEFEAAYRLAPQTQYLHVWFVMQWLALNNRVEEAEKMRASIIERYRFASTEFWFEKNICLIQSGKKEEGLKMLSEVKIHWHKAACFSLLSMKVEASAELKKIKGEGNHYLGLLNHPAWDNIRTEPEFQKLLARKKIVYEDYKSRYSKYYNDLAREIK